MRIDAIAVYALLILFGAGVSAMIIARLYSRASKEISFVRTGFRGQKGIMNGGAIVLPVLHETILVNMNTIRLEVRQNFCPRDCDAFDQCEMFVVARIEPVGNMAASDDECVTLCNRESVP